MSLSNEIYKLLEEESKKSSINEAYWMIREQLFIAKEELKTLQNALIYNEETKCLVMIKNDTN